MRPRAFSGLSKLAIVAAVSGLSAACSSDVARFDENPFRSTRTASAPQHEAAAAPVARVESAPLAPAGAAVAAAPPPAGDSPFATQADPGLTTGSLPPAPAFGSSNPQTPAVRQMAMANAGGAAPVAAGRGGWSAAGGTTIRAAPGDTVESLSRRYGVPGSAIAQANGFSSGQALSAGQPVVIPTYSMAVASAAPRAEPAPPRAEAAAPVRPAQARPAPAQPRVAAAAPAPARIAAAPAAPARMAAARPASDLATAPVPAARMAWTPGPAAAQPAQRAAVRREAPRPATHTVAMGDSLTSIAARYGVTRQQLAQANGRPLDRPIRIGETLRLPGAAPAVAARPAPAAQPVAARPAPAQTAAPAVRREQAQRAVAAAQASPAGRRADPRPTAAIPPSAPAISQQAELAPPPAPAPAAAAAPASPQPAGPAPQAEAPPAPTPASASADPSFRWPVRGRVITGFRPGANDGIKLAVPEGTPVKAADDGVVAYAGNELRGYGNLVLVRHANGYVTAYAHNSRLNVRRGDQVRRGQTIATAGQTGGVSSPQLHFEIRRGSTPVDPMTFLAAN